MLVTKAMRLTLGTLLAGDTTNLNQAANQNKVRLFVNNIVPNENSVVGDFTEATFTGYAGINQALGAPSTITDPISGQQKIIIAPTSGSYVFSATGAVSPPQTVYGFYLTDKNSTKVLAFQLLPVPITITNSGDGLVLDFVELDFVTSPIS
jgi:hypothetical protein